MRRFRSNLIKDLIDTLDPEPTREGLRETPERVSRAWEEWVSGYGQDPCATLKTFKDGADGCDQLVIVRNIPVYSHCEHHLAPFFGVAHVGYIPRGKVVGLSKLSRVVDIFAKRLQVQERLTNQIADALQDNLEPIGVGVLIECRHLCMESRGISRAGTSTKTSALRGALRNDQDARAEFLKLAVG